MKTSKKQTSSLKCNICGAELILVETSSKTINNNPAPITKTIYRCSDIVCQEETDKKSAKRIELIEQRVLMQETRKKASLDLKNAAALLNQTTK